LRQFHLGRPLSYFNIKFQFGSKFKVLSPLSLITPLSLFLFTFLQIVLSVYKSTCHVFPFNKGQWVFSFHNKHIAGQHAWDLYLIITICPMFLLNSIPNFFLCKDLALPKTGIVARTFHVRNSCSQAFALGWCIAHSFCILLSLFASFFPLKLEKRDKRLWKQET